MVFVTGASGLLGSHLLFRLLSKDKKVRALIRSDEAKGRINRVFSCYHHEPGSLLEKIDWVYGDVTNRSSLEAAFDGVEEVYHCAAYVSFDKAAYQKMDAINVRGTETIVHLCLKNKVDKLVHVSSIAAIGKPTDGRDITEDGGWPGGNMSAYAKTKTESEKRVWEGIDKGLKAVIVNPSVILGPGNVNSGSGKLIKQAAKKMLFYTKGATGFVDVRDVVEAMTLLMCSEIHSERFIINAWNKSYQELLTSLSKGLGKKALKIYAPPWVTEIAWRVAGFMSKVKGGEPNLTKASARTAHTFQYYNAEKLDGAINFGYCSFEESIDHTAKQYGKFKD